MPKKKRADVQPPLPYTLNGRKYRRPEPAPPGRPYKWPWLELRIDDSFDCPVRPKRLYGTKANVEERTGREFSIHPIEINGEPGSRVFRVA